MKKSLNLLVILSVVLTATVFPIEIKAADSAEKIVDTVSEKLNTAKSLQIHFTASSNGQSLKGQILVAGNKFYLETPQIAAWHNGQFQWILNKSDNEVNLSQPDPDELQQINPLSVISKFKNNFKAKIDKKTSTQTILTLTPKTKSSENRSATLSVNNSTMLPETISVTQNNGQSVSIIISSLKTGTKVNESVFQFDKKKYPNAQIIDLR